MKFTIKTLFAIAFTALTFNALVSSTVSADEIIVESTSLDSISVEEEHGILFMREEEKLARDVYLTLYDIWGLSIFKNIAKSEQTHTETIKALIEKYQLADPVVDDTVGVFTDYHFVEVFEALVAKGSESLEGALQVGTEIEELDIKDIAESIAVVDGNDDVVNVYSELMKGSRNHLRSFWDVLTSNGFTYVPTHISQEEFDAIINSPMETTNLK
ncbi:hypothetical protein THMIRHAM_19270 [Thiomicrorhabdus immobilis]|uniref:DUF2202 domain-containing protein n=1 Tax=Thiomicrorhabdus immobilis TaxID=2791037 RepID=A0ABM7MFA7_9GAMM|nr:DUF2202 domain-containing protein [Thiomicrorhabdus immobilis]BCN94142.1 hypothetical protein THMIRHAM_19270 [Thiomicrorhabdus immobilis]